MSTEHLFQSVNEILENSTTRYFLDLHTDERLDSFFEYTPSETVFSFSSLSRSQRPLIKGMLDHNTVSNNREATAFSALGSIEHRQGDGGTVLTLDLQAPHDSNRPNQAVRIIATSDGPITAYDRRSDFSYTMNPHDFIDLSLRAADLYPAKARRIMQFLRSENMAENIEAFYPFWLELAEKCRGTTETISVADHCVEQNDSTDHRIRIGRKEREEPTLSAIDLSIEHSLQRLDTDHEIITRLDLSYTSATQDSSHAERHVLETCLPPELHLTRAQFFTDKTGVIAVTELDALDLNLLQQFRAATELALASTAKRP